MKFDLNKEMKPWIELINNNLKWAIAFIIRTVMMIILISVTIVMLKWTGIVKDLRGLLKDTKGIKVEADKPKIKSKPSIPSYKSDIKDISSIQEILKQKIQEKKDEN